MSHKFSAINSKLNRPSSSNSKSFGSTSYILGGYTFGSSLTNNTTTSPISNSNPTTSTTPSTITTSTASTSINNSNESVDYQELPLAYAMTAAGSPTTTLQTASSFTYYEAQPVMDEFDQETLQLILNNSSKLLVSQAEEILKRNPYSDNNSSVPTASFL